MLVASFANSARLKPEIRLAQAVSEYEAALSGEQKAAFRISRSQTRESPPDVSDVMRLTAEIDRCASRKGRRCFGPRLTNLLQAVQQFASLGDIIIGGSQNLIACGVWSLVRMTLLAISQSGSHLEKLSIIFMDVGRSAPRYQSMALLYPRSKELQAYLCEYFIAVVGLCQETANFAKKSTLAQISSNLVDSAIKKFQSELDLWARSIKEEGTLLSSQTIKEEAKDNSTFRGLVLKSASATSYRRKMQARLYWLDACSTYDYVTTWKQARKRGSPTWFIQSAKYLDWRKDRESPRSDSLYLTGTLGSGKTVLMASMIDDLNLFAPKGTTAYFFCRHDINESLKARTVIGCLAGQLIQQSANIDKLDEEFGQGLSYVDCDRVIQLLGRVLSGTSKVYHFVLDGVDDCEDSERDALLQLLRQLQRKIPLLLCVSFRAGINSELITGPGIFTSLQILSIPANNPDIGEFIVAELEARLESGKLSIGNAAIILEIQDALQAGAQGMFLWVALQIDTICEEKTDKAIRNALKDLPRDLSETFRRILQKSGQTGAARYQDKVLKYVAAACRPLTTEELREALSVVPGNTIWNASKLINDIHATLACCGSLIIIDEEEFTVRFAHHSIKQFLISPRDFSKYQFTLHNANNEMGQIIVTYLNYGVFDTQVSRTVVPRIPAKEAPSQILNSILGQSSGVKQLAMGLLRSRKQTGYDIGKILADASNSHHESATDFHLLPYAKTYWYNHTGFFWENNSWPMLSLWLRLLNSGHVKMNAETRFRIRDRVGRDYITRARVRLLRGIRIAALANRIEMLKGDMNGMVIGTKHGKGAIFREIVFAAMRDMEETRMLGKYEVANIMRDRPICDPDYILLEPLDEEFGRSGN